MNKPVDKQAKRAKRAMEAAEKIARAFVSLGHDATVDHAVACPLIKVGDMEFVVSERAMKRAGTWSVRAPNENESTEVYCPSTLTELGAGSVGSLSFLIKCVAESRERKVAYAKREKIIESARAIIGSVPREKDSSHARAAVDPVRDYYGKPSERVSFNVSVPNERAEEFARLVTGFFGV